MKTRAASGVIASLFMGAIVAVMPGSARALSCEAMNVLDLPADGAVDVPTDTLVWGYFPELDRLLGPSGEVVDVDARALLVGSPSAPEALSVLVPRAPLAPNTDYTIVRQYDDDRANDRRTSFRTGAGPTRSSPAVPTLLASSTGAGSGFEDAVVRWQSFTFEGIAEHQLGLLADVADPGDGAAAAPRALTSVRELLIDTEADLPTSPRPTVIEWVSRDDDLTVGIGNCFTWSLDTDARQDIRFGAFDLAGNFSGWSDAVALELPSQTEATAEVATEREAAASHNIQKPRSAIANCSTATAPGGALPSAPAWLSIGLALAMLARRRVPRGAGW